MIVYRIAKSRQRANDLSGTGAFRAGGRWNSSGNFVLYTSESQALALLEVLVHLEESELPPDMYIATIEIDDKAPVYEMKDNELPDDWRAPENISVKNRGDLLLRDKKYLAFKARSAVMPEEYNWVLNPAHESFGKHVRIIKVEKLEVDGRLKK
jgi:RES domain-containing protein